MRSFVRVAIVFACLAGLPSVSHAGNILINSGFENPDCDIAGNCSNGSWGLFATIPGWTSTGFPIEIGDVINYGIVGQEGDQVLELDSTGNAVVSQVVAGPAVLTLSFLYADRNNGIAETFDLYWNNVLVQSFAPLANPTNSAMQFYSTTLIALGGVNTLSFVGTGASDSFGALIDDVKLETVPDGGATALLLGMGLVALRRLRRSIQ